MLSLPVLSIELHQAKLKPVTQRMQIKSPVNMKSLVNFSLCFLRARSLSLTNRVRITHEKRFWEMKSSRRFSAKTNYKHAAFLESSNGKLYRDL